MEFSRSSTAMRKCRRFMAHSLGWFATTARGRRERRADFGAPAAAIFGEKEEKIAHGGKIDGVNDGTPFAPGMDQLGIRKHKQLGRHGVGGRGEPARDF